MSKLIVDADLLKNAADRLNKEIEANQCALDNAHAAVEVAIVTKYELRAKLIALNEDIAKHERHIERKRCLDAMSYTVKEGDTLSNICIFLFGSRNINHNVAVIARINQINNPDRIRPGQVLRLSQSAIVEAN